MCCEGMKQYSIACHDHAKVPNIIVKEEKDALKFAFLDRSMYFCTRKWDIILLQTKGFGI
jgi:hypothetical protein